MAYDRPELLLVGAAQNLVLGDLPKDPVIRPNLDEGFDAYQVQQVNPEPRW